MIYQFHQAHAQVAKNGPHPHHDDRIDTSRGQFGDCSLELDWIRAFGNDKCQSKRGGQRRKRSLIELCGRICRVTEQPDPFLAGQDFPQELDALGGK